MHLPLSAGPTVFKKYLILVHRYVGIAISLLMAAWCVSGIVMMYVGFPALEERERLAGLAPLDLTACCEFDAALANIGDGPIDSFVVEMLGERPVIRIRDEYGSVIADLRSGELVTLVDAAAAEPIAATHARAVQGEARPALIDSIETDQWTVTGAYDADRPMYRFAVGDPAGTELYVASTSGEVVLDTTRQERFWNWVGAVTHWLYPSILRQNAAAWSQVVIWTSLVGTFLTVTGLWLGVMQIRAGRSGKFSPYRGWNWWHHVSGLVFGVLTLTWVLSGFLSMSPWGWFDGTGSGAERARLRELEFTSGDALAALRRLTTLPAGTVQITSAPLAGKLFLALDSGVSRVRFDAASLEPAPLVEADLKAAAARLVPEAPIASTGLLAAGDAYYYDDHEGSRAYPVYRVVLGDAERTRYYLDPVTGQLRQKTDRDGRWYRWLFEAFHRWDFSAGIRQRPLWDLIVLPLMLGVTALSFTGVWLGFRRLRA